MKLHEPKGVIIDSIVMSYYLVIQKLRKNTTKRK